MKELVKVLDSFKIEDIETARDELHLSVVENEIDAINLYLTMSMYDKLFNGDSKKNNGLKHLIKDKAIDEFKKYGEKHIKRGCCKIEECETGVVYDFSNDPVWVEISEEEKKITELRKRREDFLKKIDPVKGYIIDVDEDTGEMRKIYAPLKTSTTSIKITIK